MRKHCRDGESGLVRGATGMRSPINIVWHRPCKWHHGTDASAAQLKASSLMSTHRSGYLNDMESTSASPREADNRGQRVRQILSHLMGSMHHAGPNVAPGKPSLSQSLDRV